MILGLYRHYKGGLYLALWTVWESTNSQIRDEKVLYFSFKTRHFNVRRLTEFFEGPMKSLKYPLDAAQVYSYLKDPVFRFTRVFPRGQPRNSQR